MSKVPSNMTALVEASSLLREVAAPERGKRALLLLSRNLPWSYRHIKAVWYQEERTTVDADEMKQLRRAAKLAQEDNEAGNEIRELRERLARIESLLLAPRSELDSENAPTFRVVAGRCVRED